MLMLLFYLLVVVLVVIIVELGLPRVACAFLLAILGKSWGIIPAFDSNPKKIVLLTMIVGMVLILSLARDYYIVLIKKLSIKTWA